MSSVGLVIARMNTAVPREIAWQHLVDSELRGHWWPELELDPRLDGKVAERWSDGDADAGGGPGATRDAVGTVDVLVEGHALGFRWRDRSDQFETEVLITLRSNDGGTGITVTETGFGRFADSHSRVADAQQGWIDLITDYVSVLSSAEYEPVAKEVAGPGIMPGVTEASDAESAIFDDAVVAEGTAVAEPAAVAEPQNGETALADLADADEPDADESESESDADESGFDKSGLDESGLGESSLDDTDSDTDTDSNTGEPDTGESDIEVTDIDEPETWVPETITTEIEVVVEAVEGEIVERSSFEELGFEGLDIDGETEGTESEDIEVEAEPVLGELVAEVSFVEASIVDSDAVEGYLPNDGELEVEAEPEAVEIEVDPDEPDFDSLIRGS